MSEEGHSAAASSSSHKSSVKPAILAIAKLEHRYIETWVKYHLTLGFDHIFLYDNEDVPTYESLLKDYSEWMTVIHFPGNSFNRGVQHLAYSHFLANIKETNPHEITHLAVIDIDEFICLKKHTSIKDFIAQFFTGNCGSITMNWKMFGSSGKSMYEPIPEPIRFTRCDSNNSEQIKCISDLSKIKSIINPHFTILQKGFIRKSSSGLISGGCTCKNNPHDEYIQLNHYKSKTREEYDIIIRRGRSDVPKNSKQQYINLTRFEQFDRNEAEDLTAKTFYETCVIPRFGTHIPPLDPPTATAHVPKIDPLAEPSTEPAP